MTELVSARSRFPVRLCDCCICPTTRYFVVFMLFLGMANSYIRRTNMSVAIVAMVNHTAIKTEPDISSSEICPNRNITKIDSLQDGKFIWDSKMQGYILSSFFYGYVITQIPFGLLAKKYGAMRFLGWGMLLNSIFAFFVPLAARNFGSVGICVVRFLQGLGEGPIVPCAHALLAKWIPPNERSRMGAAVYSGAQFGTVVSLPISGVLAEYGFDGGWPSIFYIFGAISLIWSVAFLIWVFEDPNSHPTIDEQERKYILNSVWGSEDNQKSRPPVPFKSIFTSLPFYAILIAHMGQNYGYETLMTELPTYFKQILHFSLKENGFYSALPYLAMWIFSIFISMFADWLIITERLSITATRKIMNTIGQYSPGIALLAASYMGCNRTFSLLLLTFGVGLNGAIFSGFKINHLDLSPHFAGFLMAITNCTANLVGLLAPIVVGHIINKSHTIGQWRWVFFVSAGIYIGCATFYNFFSSGLRQPWDKSINELDTEKNNKQAK